MTTSGVIPAGWSTCWTGCSDQVDLVEEIGQLVKDHMGGADPGHDPSHVERVRNMALAIGREEGADRLAARCTTHAWLQI